MLKPGQRAPAFALPGMDGGEYRLSEILATGPAVLAFFKISCPICQYTFPFLERLHGGSAGAGLRFLGISQDSKPATQFFLNDCGVTFPALLDTYESGYAVSNAFGIRRVPSVFVIDPDGFIDLATEGFVKADLEELGGRIGVSPFRDGENVPAYRPG